MQTKLEAGHVVDLEARPTEAHQISYEWYCLAKSAELFLAGKKMDIKSSVIFDEAMIGSSYLMQCTANPTSDYYLPRYGKWSINDLLRMQSVFDQMLPTRKVLS